MRVAIDARPALDPRRTGVGHYTARITRALPLADPGARYTAWYLHARGAFRPRRFFADVAAANFDERPSRFPARVFQPVSFRFGVPRLEWLLDFDVVLGTNFLPPPTRRPAVLVVHDLAFRRMPETAPHMDGRWERRFERWLDRAARLIVPSESARRDLVELCGVAEERVDAIPHGVDPLRLPDDDEAAAARGRLGAVEPYLLFVGGLEPRKNLPALIRAFARVSGHGRLVIAGGPVRWLPDEAERVRGLVDGLPARVRERVALTGYVRDDEKLALLAGATALAYPSLYEGFGLPLLEAMSAGVPVLASNVSALPEVAGDAAVLVDPRDDSAIAEGLRRLLEDPALRERLRREGRARAALFTWEEAARRTASALRRALAG